MKDKNFFGMSIRNGRAKIKVNAFLEGLSLNFVHWKSYMFCLKAIYFLFLLNKPKMKTKSCHLY